MAHENETNYVPTSFLSEEEIVIQMLSDDTTITMLTNRGRRFFFHRNKNLDRKTGYWHDKKDFSVMPFTQEER